MTERHARASLFAEAVGHFPGGVNSPVRAMRSVGREFPLFLSEAAGATVTDADGNRYVDLVGSWGPMIVGHAHPAVVEAVREAMGRGSSFGAPTQGESDLATRVKRVYPQIELLRFVSSGTEASMSALRAGPQSHTGREKVLKFAGCYHGHVDALLAEAGSGSRRSASRHRPACPPRSRPAPSSCPTTTTTRSTGRSPPTAPTWPARSSRACPATWASSRRRAGSWSGSQAALPRRPARCFVVDDVMSGFRVAAGGAVELYGLDPDLIVLGKIVGGGLPAAAFGGRREIMELLAPIGSTYQAGTLSGNPLAMAAGCVTLDLLQEPGVYDALDAASRPARGRTRRRRRRRPLRAARRLDGDAVLPARARCARSPRPPSRPPARFAAFHAHCLEQGVYLPPSQFEACVRLDRARRCRDRRASSPRPGRSSRGSAGDRGGRGPRPRREPGLGGGAASRSPPARPLYGPARRRRASRSASRPSTRASSCTTPPAGCSRRADREQAILLGDYLYAAGLVEICRAGDLDAVTTLAELIATVSDRRSRGLTDDSDGVGAAPWPRSSRRPTGPRDEGPARLDRAAAARGRAGRDHGRGRPAPRDHRDRRPHDEGRRARRCCSATCKRLDAAGADQPVRHRAADVPGARRRRRSRRCASASPACSSCCSRRRACSPCSTPRHRPAHR